MNRDSNLDFGNCSPCYHWTTLYNAYYLNHGPLIRYVKLRVAHAPGIFSPPPRVSDPDMHHGTCGTHVPWCMLISRTSGFFEVCGGENFFFEIPGACATRNFTYLVRGPWIPVDVSCGLNLISTLSMGWSGGNLASAVQFQEAGPLLVARLLPSQVPLTSNHQPPRWQGPMGWQNIAHI